MAKLKITDVATLEDADAWQAQESKPLYDELAKIDAKQAEVMAGIVERKRAIRDALLDIERHATERRANLRPSDAGPDQVVG